MRPAVAHPLAKSVRKARVDVCGRATDLVLTGFSNQIMIIATQREKMGTLVVASRDAKVLSRGSGGPDPTFSVRTLMGRRNDPIPELLARTLIERISSSKGDGSEKSLLLCVNLVESSTAVAKSLIEKIDAHKVQLSPCAHKPFAQRSNHADTTDAPAPADMVIIVFRVLNIV